jgi:hypothetical protein
MYFKINGMSSNNTSGNYISRISCMQGEHTSLAESGLSVPSTQKTLIWRLVAFGNDFWWHSGHGRLNVRFLDHIKLDASAGRIPLEREISPSQRPLPTQHTTHETNIPSLSGVRSRDPSNQAVSDLRLRPYGPRDWPCGKESDRISRSESWVTVFTKRRKMQ